MAKRLLIVKYVILVTVVLCAVIAVERLVKINRWTESSSPVVSDLKYDPSLPLNFIDVDELLNERYSRCIFGLSKPFCSLPADKKLEIFRRDKQRKSPDADTIQDRFQHVKASLNRTEKWFRLISNVMTLMESLGAKPFVIEPSVLFCMLPSFKKHNLLLTGFHPDLALDDVIRFGVFERDAKKLAEMDVKKRLQSGGFSEIEKTLLCGYNATDCSQIIYIYLGRGALKAQVSVFYKTNSYLSFSLPKFVKDDVQQTSAILENFHVRSIKGPQTATGTIRELFIPYNLQYFLKEMESAELNRCIAPLARNSTQQHPFLTSEQLVTRVGLALRALKKVLAPKLVNFWLWSSSLSGYDEYCDVFHYTTELELALDQRAVEFLNLTTVLSESKFLEIQSDVASNPNSEIHLDAHGLHINITILHEDSNRTWRCKGLDGLYDEYRLPYPANPLCSIDVFGQKVNAPCVLDEGVEKSASTS